MNDSKQISSDQLLFSGGETGQLIRSIDWGYTPLGNIKAWPQSLLSAVNLCINSRFPMAVWWGKDLILIYNDSYRTFLGAKHPTVLGSLGKDVWPEHWDVFGPHLMGVLTEGKPTWIENEKFLINRNGYDEECYFTFSHSPIYEESGLVAGVFTTVAETTSLVLNKLEILRLRDEQLYSIFMQAPVAISILKGPELSVEMANPKILELWGKNVDQIMHRPILQALAEAKGQGLEELLEKVYRRGEQAVHEEVPVSLIRRGELDHFYVKLIYQPLREADGTISGVIVLADDITEQVNARRRSEENETRLRMAVESMHLGTWDYNPISGELTWSEECQKIYALPKGHQVDFKTFGEHIHPDDKKFVESEIEKSMDPSSAGSYDLTYRIIRFTDRSTRWIRAQGKVYFNNQRQPERFIGTVVDTTAERERNQKLLENELRMRLAVQASEMGTFDWDIVNSQFQYSDRLANIFGFTDTINLKQEDFSERIHPDDRQLRLDAHEIAFKTGVLFYEARILWKDNSEHWVRLNGQVVYDIRGVPERMYGTTLDITEQKNQTSILETKVAERSLSLQKKNEELQLSEERYHKMTEEIQDYAIILLDRDGNILNWNRGAEKIKGYTQEEIIGKSFKNFYLDSDRNDKLPEKLINIAVENGRAMQEGWRKRKDGTKFWGSIVITALHDDNNNVIGFSKVTRDLTERKIAEDKMKQYTAELLLRNRELEQFAYIASHDLQEPLRKIQTFTEVLEKNVDNLRMREKYFKKINSSASRMSELIISVLNYSRLGNTDALLEMTDLNIILEGVLADYELLIDERNATIKSDTLPTIKGISLQLSQLFANLISNSLKFCEAPPVITISSRVLLGSEIGKQYASLNPSGRYLELIFTDNGIGFEQQYADKIFTIFQRLNSREDYSGTGIGLALCKKIVDNHQGFIDAKSKLGEGAEFYIYLPFAIDSNLL